MTDPCDHPQSPPRTKGASALCWRDASVAAGQRQRGGQKPGSFVSCTAFHLPEPRIGPRMKQLASEWLGLRGMAQKKQRTMQQHYNH